MSDETGLHRLREKRRGVAHESQPRSVGWTVLDEALNIVERELEHLGLVGARLKYEFFSERSRARGSDDPDVAFALDNSLGLKENGDWIVRFSWTTNIHRSERSQS